MRGTLFALLLAACGDARPLDGTADGGAGDATPIAMELGVGTDSFESIDAEHPVEVIFGPQGGYHFWAAVHIEDDTVTRGAVTITSTFVDTGQRAGFPYMNVHVFDPAPDGHFEELALTAFIDEPEVARGRRVHVVIEVETSDGRVGTDEAIVIPQ